MKALKTLSMLILCSLCLTNVKAQEGWVTFKTDSKKTIVCQNEGLVVTATVYDNVRYVWPTQVGVKKVLEDNAIRVNTSSVGPVEIALQVQFEDGVQRDTSITITVLPNPNPEIVLSNNKIEVQNPKNYKGYRWILNKRGIDDYKNESYKNPQPGIYCVRVTDKNGCKAISETVEVK